jgi:hypothetical protein
MEGAGLEFGRELRGTIGGCEMSGDEGRPGTSEGEVTEQVPKPLLDATVDLDATRFDLPASGPREDDVTAVFLSPAPVTDTTVAFDETAVDAGLTSAFTAPAVDPDATVAFATADPDATVAFATVDPGASAVFEPTPVGDATAVLDRPADAGPAWAEVPGAPLTHGRPFAAPAAQSESPVFRITPQEGAPAAPAWPTVKGRRRRRGRLATVLVPMVPILAAAGVAAFILFNRLGTSGPALTITSVSVTSPPTASCGQAVHVSAVINTNGGAGTIAYRWTRSDGQETPAQQLNATRDQTSYPVPLSWQIQGRGRFDAVATLTVTSPSGASPAVARFLYTC